MTFISLCLISKFGISQCAIESWSLQKRVDVSALIVEGKVIEQYPFREVGRNAIYTSSVIEVYKIFKGNVSAPYLIEVITFGGQIGLEKHHADPELELQTNDVGVFLLTTNVVKTPDFVTSNGKPKYQGSASVQSFVSYDLDDNKAFDGSEVFSGISTILYERLQLYTKQKFSLGKSFGYNPERLKYRPTATPVITNFNGVNSGNAGIDDIITINGIYFGKTRGKGRVEFIDANYGDGRRMKTPYAADYTVWNDTQIKVRIPSRAGTGTIKVATNDSGSSISFTGFKINFSHLNASFQPSGNAEQYYKTDLRNDNNKGGYTFQFNTRFKANTPMVNSFLRSMETWRCGTLVNWDIGRDTTIKDIDGDQVNIVRLTKFADSRLAVCYSYWQGCYINGTDMEWYVNEMDIEADSSRNWYFGTGTVGGSQYDFQSVLSHELGHGHQLGHVIAGSEMMHYSISNGQKKSSLSTNDLNGGNYVKDKSIKMNVCSGSAMKALAQSACGYTKALSGFKTDKIVACPKSNILISDTTIGVVKTYLWHFGSNATPTTASGKGPHTIKYDSEGAKTIKLFATNDFGTDSSIKIAYITILPLKPKTPTNLVFEDTACLGLTTLAVDSFSDPNTLTWQLPSQATSISNTKNKKTINWNSTGGPFTFWVKAVNLCGSSDTLIAKVIVLNNPISIFTSAVNGRTVSFTNTSLYAESFKWYFGDGDSSSLINPVHIYPMGKPYNATLKAVNRCKTVVNSNAVNPVHPGFIKTDESQNSYVYPNPAHNTVYLSSDIFSYTLIDALGKVILSGTETKIDLSSVPKGIYILRAHIYNSSFSYFKISKE